MISYACEPVARGENMKAIGTFVTICLSASVLVGCWHDLDPESPSNDNFAYESDDERQARNREERPSGNQRILNRCGDCRPPNSCTLVNADLIDKHTGAVEQVQAYVCMSPR